MYCNNMSLKERMFEALLPALRVALSVKSQNVRPSFIVQNSALLVLSAIKTWHSSRLLKYQLVSVAIKFLYAIIRRNTNASRPHDSMYNLISLWELEISQQAVRCVYHLSPSLSRNLLALVESLKMAY